MEEKKSYNQVRVSVLIRTTTDARKGVIVVATKKEEYSFPYFSIKATIIIIRTIINNNNKK